MRPTVIETAVYVNSIGPVDPINMVRLFLLNLYYYYYYCKNGMLKYIYNQKLVDYTCKELSPSQKPLLNAQAFFFE